MLKWRLSSSSFYIQYAIVKRLPVEVAWVIRHADAQWDVVRTTDYAIEENTRQTFNTLAEAKQYAETMEAVGA